MKPGTEHSEITIGTDKHLGPELMTEDELVQFLRIPDISGSKDHHNVIEHLKRFRDLPRIHICNKALYPKTAILEWIKKETNRKLAVPAGIEAAMVSRE